MTKPLWDRIARDWFRHCVIDGRGIEITNDSVFIYAVDRSDARRIELGDRVIFGESAR